MRQMTSFLTRTTSMLTLATSFLTATTVCLLSVAPCQAADWGTLKGRLVFDGPAPKADAVDVTKDQQFCGKHGLLNEELVVNPKNGGLANVAIWLYVGRGDDNPPVHDSYVKTAKDKVKLVNDKCRFEPHVTLLRTTQILELGNIDPVGHNTKIDTFSPANRPINVLLPPMSTLDHQCPAKERLPAGVSCSIHPWMKSWLLVQDHPYMAVSDKDGNFEIKDLPAGTWTFQFWQERCGYLSGVSMGGNETKRGRVEITIKAGDNDLGDIKVTPELFEDKN